MIRMGCGSVGRGWRFIRRGGWSGVRLGKGRHRLKGVIIVIGKFLRGGRW